MGATIHNEKTCSYKHQWMLIESVYDTVSQILKTLILIQILTQVLSNDHDPEVMDGWLIFIIKE